jgi:hypothetical protein
MFHHENLSNRKQNKFTVIAHKKQCRELFNETRQLFLPGTLLVTIQAQLLAPFMLVDFCLAAFFN